MVHAGSVVIDALLLMARVSRCRHGDSDPLHVGYSSVTNIDLSKSVSNVFIHNSCMLVHGVASFDPLLKFGPNTVKNGILRN